MSPPTSTLGRPVLVAAAVVYVGLAVHAASVETPTVDEYAHLPAGCAYLADGRLDLYANNPPLYKELLCTAAMTRGLAVPPVPAEVGGWGPWRYGDAFFQLNRDVYLDAYFRARLVTVVVGLFVGLVLFAWGRRRFGEGVGGSLAALWLLNPTVIAHAHLATLDVACAATVLVATLALVDWAREGGALRAALVGAALGLALLVKLTALLLLPAVLVAVLLVVIRPPRRPARTVLVEVLVGALVGLSVLHAGYQLEGLLPRVGDLPLQSGTLRAAQQVLPGGLPLPLPRDFVLGFDAQRLDTEEGEFGSFLFGEVSPDGFVLYDLVVLLVKTPLPVLLLLGLARWGQRRRPLPALEAAVLVACTASLATFLLLFNKLDLGVRYLLPLLPLFAVLSAPALARVVEGRAWLPPALLGAMAVSALLTHPGHLSWFNGLALGQGHRILADSNLDWGQDLYQVPTLVREHGEPENVYLLYFGHVDPGLYGIDYAPVPPTPVEEGLVVVSHQFLVGLPYFAPAPSGRLVAVGPDHLAWLRERTPTERRGSLWVYRLERRAPDAPAPPEAP